MAQFEQLHSSVPGIASVIERMRAFSSARSPAGGAEDGVAVFNRVKFRCSPRSSTAGWTRGRGWWGAFCSRPAADGGPLPGGAAVHPS